MIPSDQRHVRMGVRAVCVFFVLFFFSYSYSCLSHLLFLFLLPPPPGPVPSLFWFLFQFFPTLAFLLTPRGFRLFLFPEVLSCDRKSVSYALYHAKELRSAAQKE